MSVAIRVHIVQTIQELSEVVATLILRQATTERYKIEELTATNELKHDVLDCLFSFAWVSLLALTNFDQVYDVSMLQILEDSKLVLDALFEVLAISHDLDGESGA